MLEKISAVVPCCCSLARRLRGLCCKCIHHVYLLRITGKFPGYLSPSAGLKFADVPNGLAAISKVPAAGWGQILAYMAFCEVSQDQSPGTPAAAGDFGFKVLTSSDPAEKTKKLSAELANGRLAMMAIIGMFFQVGVSSRCCFLYNSDGSAALFFCVVRLSFHRMV